MSSPSVASPESPVVSNEANAEARHSGKWAAAIILSIALGWLAYHFSPTVWVLSEEMSNIPSMSPEPVLAKLRAEERSDLWNNTVLRLALSGAAIGLCGLLATVLRAGRSSMASVVAVIAGAVSGGAAALIGLTAREYFDKGEPIPMISQDMRPLLCDIVVFAAASLFLTIPIAVVLGLQKSRELRLKASVVPLAAILTGLIVPIATAFALSSLTSSDVFPPLKTDLTFLWFATLAISTALLVALAGDRKPRGAASTVK